MKKKCDSFSILIKELLSVPLSSLFLLLSQMRFINVAFSYGIISSSVPWMITMFVFVFGFYGLEHIDPVEPGQCAQLVVNSGCNVANVREARLDELGSEPL